MHTSSTIVRDVRIKGSLEFHESLFLDSLFEGEISGKGDLTLGEHACVTGDIHVSQVTIFGSVKGNVFAEKTCVIKESGIVVGDIKANHIELIEGASFHGYAKIPFNSIDEPEFPEFEEASEAEEPDAIEETKEVADSAENAKDASKKSDTDESSKKKDLPAQSDTDEITSDPKENEAEKSTI